MHNVNNSGEQGNHSCAMLNLNNKKAQKIFILPPLSITLKLISNLKKEKYKLAPSFEERLSVLNLRIFYNFKRHKERH